MNDQEQKMEELFTELNSLIEEITDKEIALYQWKELYEIKSEEIIKHTDFKELYGKNNAEVRKTHVRNKLTDWYDTIKELEFSINWLTHRISYMRELIKTKRVLLEVKQYGLLRSLMLGKLNLKYFHTHLNLKNRKYNSNYLQQIQNILRHQK